MLLQTHRQGQERQRTSSCWDLFLMEDQEDLPSSEISAPFIPECHGQFAYLSKKMQGNTWMDSRGQRQSQILMGSQGQSMKTVVKLNCVSSAIIIIGGWKKYFFLCLLSPCHSTNITLPPSVSVRIIFCKKRREIRSLAYLSKYVS